jgi:hypothetical protein
VIRLIRKFRQTVRQTGALIAPLRRPNFGLRDTSQITEKPYFSAHSKMAASRCRHATGVIGAPMCLTLGDRNDSPDSIGGLRMLGQIGSVEIQARMHPLLLTPNGLRSRYTSFQHRRLSTWLGHCGFITIISTGGQKGLIYATHCRGPLTLRSSDRGRDVGHPTPPAQIRTCPIKASGSYLGCLAAKRTLGHG